MYRLPWSIFKKTKPRNSLAYLLLINFHCYLKAIWIDELIDNEPLNSVTYPLIRSVVSYDINTRRIKKPLPPLPQPSSAPTPCRQKTHWLTDRPRVRCLLYWLIACSPVRVPGGSVQIKTKCFRAYQLSRSILFRLFRWYLRDPSTSILSIHADSDNKCLCLWKLRVCQQRYI